MGINVERQELRALMLQPIRHLPSYAADYTVVCRVGKAVAAHVTGPWDVHLQSSLETALRDFPRPFHYMCPRTNQVVRAMVDSALIGPATICAAMDCPICKRSHIVYLTNEVTSDVKRAGLPLN